MTRPGSRTPGPSGQTFTLRLGLAPGSTDPSSAELVLDIAAADVWQAVLLGMVAATDAGHSVVRLSAEPTGPAPYHNE